MNFRFCAGNACVVKVAEPQHYSDNNLQAIEMPSSHCDSAGVAQVCSYLAYLVRNYLYDCSSMPLMLINQTDIFYSYEDFDEKLGDIHFLFEV